MSVKYWYINVGNPDLKVIRQVDGYALECAYCLYPGLHGANLIM
jgi:hypothetical protein